MSLMFSCHCVIVFSCKDAMFCVFANSLLKNFKLVIYNPVTNLSKTEQNSVTISKKKPCTKLRISEMG